MMMNQNQVYRNQDNFFLFFKDFLLKKSEFESLIYRYFRNLLKFK